MTSRQRCIIWVWIALIVLTCLCPPWHQGRYSAPYSPIFLPPGSATVDFSRLTLEWIAISAVCAGLYFAWPWHKVRAATLESSSGSPVNPPDLKQRIEAGLKAVNDIPEGSILRETEDGETGKLLREIEGPPLASDLYETALNLAREGDWENWRTYTEASLQEGLEEERKPTPRTPRAARAKKATPAPPRAVSEPRATIRRWHFPRIRLSRRTSLPVALLLALGFGLLWALSFSLYYRLYGPAAMVPVKQGTGQQRPPLTDGSVSLDNVIGPAPPDPRSVVKDESASAPRSQNGDALDDLIAGLPSVIRPPVYLEPCANSDPHTVEGRPQNGSFDKAGSGYGKLSIANGNAEDAAVILANATMQSGERLVYVRAGMSATMTGIKVGQYRILFQIGRLWDGSNQTPFRCVKATGVFDTLANFEERALPDGIEYSEISITLDKFVGGNAPSTDLPQNQFRFLMISASHGRPL